MAHFEIGAILSGGSTIELAKGEYKANPTSEDVLLKKGYSTVANGYADDIVIPAGMGIRRLTNGGPSDFARYEIVSLETAQAHS